MKNLLKKIQENIFRYELFDRETKIVVGVSGGPDSVCLLDILHKLQKGDSPDLIIAHINYGLRGKDSNLDEELIKKLAKKYSLPIEILKYKSERGTKTSENKLRIVRYDFFEKICKKYKANAIAVGHSLNDQAETVLMRILRGTGLRGLGAIKFKNNNIIRPLLNIPRKEIIAYLGKHKIPYRIDKTNLGTDFTRNKIRNELVPYLEKNFNSNIQKILYKFSQSAVDDYDFLSRFSREWLTANKLLKVLKLNKLHPSICREVLRLVIEKHNPNLKEIESAHIDEILKILKSSKNKRQQLTLKGLKIERIGDKLIISKS